MLFYQLTYTKQFRAQLNALPKSDQEFVWEKVQALFFDPRPDGSHKKKLKSHSNLYRLRAGNYRVFYSMVGDSVDVQGVGPRKSVYSRIDRLRNIPLTSAHQGLSVEELSTLDDEDDEDEQQVDTKTETVGFLPIDWHIPPGDMVASMPTELPRSIDASLLDALRVPEEYRSALTACRTVEQLTDAAVREDVRDRIFDAIMEPDLITLTTAPKYVLGSIDDLIYGEDFDQIGMLLRLDPEQMKYVNWAISGSGPVLLKGGPGTGKSIIGVHRAAALVDRLRQAGIAQPRILYTTFTRSLAESSRQLIERLAGNHSALIDVRHLDLLHLEILDANNAKRTIIDDGQRRAYVKKALDRIGRDQVGATQADKVDHLSLDYLSDEIDKVIVGRGLRSEAEYLGESRGGRRVRLTAGQRRTIWRLHEIRSDLLRNKNVRTWEQSRAVALHLVERGKGPIPYDALIVDEAQDLDPNALRMLIGLCKSTDRVFVTADPNQSIYGSGFQWTAVHADLKFRGRTSVLRRNYRSTREIGMGAGACLKGSELDDDDSALLEYVHSGPKPVLRLIKPGQDYLAASMDYIELARRRNHIGYGGIGILVPLNDFGRLLERQLRERGYPADFVRGDHIDLQSPRIKILTLHSSKGLEFPVVVLAGLEHRIKHARELESADAGERSELQQLNRRLLFVAMTRAMKELLVVLPENVEDPILAGIGEPAWATEYWPANTAV